MRTLTPAPAGRAPQLQCKAAKLHAGSRAAECYCAGMECTGLGARASRQAWILQVRLACIERLLFPASRWAVTGVCTQLDCWPSTWHLTLHPEPNCLPLSMAPPSCLWSFLLA